MKKFLMGTFLVMAMMLCVNLQVSACTFINAQTSASFINQTDYARLQKIGNNLVKANNISHRYTFNFASFKQHGAFPIIMDGTTSYLNDMDLHNNRVILIELSEYARLTSDDEIAALMAHELAQGEHSYTGVLNGQLMFTKNGMFPFNYFAKVNELKFDKTAVDYLVKAGYNPKAFSSALNKTTGEWRGTFWGRHNKTQKRVNNINNYISAKYNK